MCKPKNLGRLALNKRSGRPSLKACDAQNLDHHRPHAVGFPIRVLDGLALGEATALSLGLPLGAVRGVLVAVLALATGAAMAQTGLIAFVGLAAPHLVRSIVKTTHARLLVLSALMGGLLLMAADVLARWIIAPQELPVGVLTAVLGGSYLLWLMHRRRRPGGFL
jgi:iron complex transport system permease protein